MLIKELDKNKQKVFHVILIFTSVAGFCFVLLNSYRGQIDLAVVELIITLVSIGLLVVLQKTVSVAKFKRLALIFTLVFFSTMMFAISNDGVSITIFSWVLIIPLASYLLLGVKLGFIVTAVYYNISIVLFFGGFTGHPAMQDKVAYANIIICALFLWGLAHSYEHASQSARKTLRKMAISDHLTGLYNRTTMSQLFDQVLLQAEQQSETVSLVLFDLDSFKSINDQFGHDTGDQVLIKFARILQDAVAKKGVAFRIGGEEFAIIFSARSDLIILSLAENVRRATEKIIINEAPSDMSISVSAGVATALPESAVLSQMMVTADRRMYHGKSQGRNVVIHKG